jgi:hypothetical protein
MARKPIAPAKRPGVEVMKRFETDWEQIRGLLVLAAVVVALGWAVAICFADGTALWLGVITVVLITAALLVASAEWQPRTLSLLALLGIVLVGLITVSLGRTALEGRAGDQALEQLGRMDNAVRELDAIRTAGTMASPAAGPAAAAILLACERAASISTGESGKCPDAIADGRPMSAAADRSAPGTLPVAMATARLRLAEYRADVLDQPEDAVEVEAAGTALAAAIAALSGEQPDPVSALDALSAGGDAIVESVIGEDPPLVIETAGWVVLAIGALLIWRVIAKRSFGELPGPVTISLNSGAQRAATEAEIKISDAAQRAAFRVAVLRNVSEPGALPGAAAMQSLTDLLEVPGVDSWFAPLVAALKTILAVPRGFKVSADVVPPETKDGRWVVLVRVSDLDSGKEVGVSTQTGDSDIKACRSAGYWAAAVVLSRSSRIPSWASWDSQTSTALALYDEPDPAPAACYPQALAKAPSSGVLLQKLAAEYAINERLLDSVSMSARAVAAHPRYHVACYRLADGINMLADNPGEWMEASLAERRRILGQLERALTAIRADATGLTRISADFRTGGWGNPDAACHPVDLG